jgi:tetratricopeptide (TPR) repeat protein
MKKTVNFIVITLTIVIAHAQTPDWKQTEQLFNNGKFNEVVSICTEVIARDSLNALALQYRGSAYLENGFYSLAIEDFDALEMFHPLSPAILAKRGLCNYFLREYKSSSLDFTLALEKDSLNALYAYNLAQVEQCMYRWKDAVNHYTMAIRLNKQYADAYRNRGYIHLTRGHFPEAMKDFDSALKYHQLDETVILYRGMALTSMKHYKEANEMFNRCIRLKSRNGPAYYNRGLVNFQLHNYFLARADMDSAILYKPDMEIAYFNRAICTLELAGKNTIDCCEDFRKAAELGYMEALDYLKKYCE